MHQANRDVVRTLLAIDELRWPDSLLAETKRPDIVQLLLQRLNPAANNEAMHTAAASGRISIVKLLLQDGRSDPSEVFLAGWTLRYCPSPRLVKLFLSDPRVDPSIHQSKALRLTIRKKAYGTFAKGVMAILLEDGRCNPAVQDNLAIRNAAYLGYINVVRLLLEDPRVDRTARNNEALFIATKRRYMKIVALLRGTQH